MVYNMRKVFLLSRTFMKVKYENWDLDVFLI